MYSLTPYPLTPIGSFIGLILVLLPLIPRIYKRNFSLPVWGYALWILVCNFIMFVNTIIWHDNVDIVAPVWCDIVTKLQIGAGVGTRACAFIICVRLYRITVKTIQGSSAEPDRRQGLNFLIFELFLIIGLPILVMALYIIVQPLRFELFEEMGCTYAEYSYVGYIIYYAPVLVINLGSAFLAPLTLRFLFRHRRETNELLSSRQTFTSYEYNRLMAIACLDTAFNLPVLILTTVLSIVSGSNDALNFPYISWKNVHDGAGGNYLGMSLSSIVPVPASEWSANGWIVFNVKWNEWLYVVHAIIFFGAFGTTPEMRRHYLAALWFIPERCGYQRRPVSEEKTLPDVAFRINPGLQMADRAVVNRRRDPLSFLESGISEYSSGPAGMTETKDIAVDFSEHSIETGTSVKTDNGVALDSVMLPAL